MLSAMQLLTLLIAHLLSQESINTRITQIFMRVPLEAAFPYARLEVVSFHQKAGRIVLTFEAHLAHDGKTATALEDLGNILKRELLALQNLVIEEQEAPLSIREQDAHFSYDPRGLWRLKQRYQLFMEAPNDER
jgi:hypothetical protein